jgi:hypothetical protein
MARETQGRAGGGGRRETARRLLLLLLLSIVCHLDLNRARSWLLVTNLVACGTEVRSTCVLILASSCLDADVPMNGLGGVSVRLVDGRRGTGLVGTFIFVPFCDPGEVVLRTTAIDLEERVKM